MMTRSTETSAANDSSGGASAPRSPRQINVNQRERVISGVLGAALLGLMPRRGPLGKAVFGLFGAGLLYRGASGHCDVYEAMGTNSTDHERLQPGAPTAAKAVSHSITIGKPADELYRYWRDPQNLSLIMGHFAEVTAQGDEHQRWTVRAPFSRGLTWTSRITEDRPGELLRWESTERAELPNEGSLRFHPASGDRGTEVTLSVRFDPPGGRLGDAVMKRLSIVPALLVQKALNRFKSLVETGEIPTLEKNPSARARGTADHR